MKNLKLIISNNEIEDLVKQGKAEYKSWGQRRKDLVYIGEHIYWHHTESHYHYVGERYPAPNKDAHDCGWQTKEDLEEFIAAFDQTQYDGPVFIKLLNV